MMIVVVIIYAICWLPLHVLTIAGDINRTLYNLPGMNIVWTAAHWLAMSNCMYNPFIYCWMNAKFRNGFIRVIRCVTCGLTKPRNGIELQQMRFHPTGTLSVGNSYSAPFRHSAASHTEYSVLNSRYGGTVLSRDSNNRFSDSGIA